MWGSLLTLLCSAALVNTKLIYRTPERQGRSQQEIKQEVPELYSSATDLIEATGVIAETHEVVTEDGYILQLHRLPNPNLNTSKVVLLLHGLGGSSDNWMLYYEKSLPYHLLLAGYDVWMASFRGSVYSRKHTVYKSSQDRYWDYSIHELGTYDMTAFVDTVLNETGANKIFLLGHSRGTTTSYILLAKKPEYNERVALLISMAPVAYTRHVKSQLLGMILRRLTVREGRQIRRVIGQNYLGAVGDNASKTLRVLFCRALGLFGRVCTRANELFLGRDYLNSEKKLMNVLGHYPDAMSGNELLHYLQISKEDKFRPFVYETKALNMAKYNTSSPKEYDLSQISVPVSFHYSSGDLLVAKQDMDKLIAQIKNVAGVFKIANKRFNHVNFVVSPVSAELVYKPTIEFMEKFVPKEIK